jgi:hypothetical protein
VQRDTTSVIPARTRRAVSSAASTNTFTRHQRDTAYHAQVERYVAWARTLLDDTPSTIDSPMIRERRVEAARAVLDVLWAVLCEHNAQEGELHPVPGLTAHRFQPELRRLAGRRAREALSESFDLDLLREQLRLSRRKLLFGE